MLSALRKVVSRQRERRRSAEEEFDRLVLDLADDKEPDAEEVERILSVSGRSLEYLEHAVGLVTSRRRWAEVAATEPALKKELAAAKAEREQLDQDFEEFGKQHRTAREKIDAHETTILKKLHEVGAAKQRLRQTAERDRDREQRLQQLGDRRESVCIKMGALKDTKGTEFTKLQARRAQLETQIQAIEDEVLAV